MLPIVNVIIFANEEMKDSKLPKGVLSIGFKPVLFHLISSFENLKDEYFFQFFIICHKNEIEIMEDEMERWEKGDIYFIPTKYRNMDTRILYFYLNSAFHKSCDFYILTSIYFPFFSETTISYFLDKYKKNPLILIGNLPYGKNSFPKIMIKNEKGIFSENGVYNFLYFTILSEYEFKQIYSIYYPMDESYFNCIFFRTILLPDYYSSFDLNPLLSLKDFHYLQYLYHENEKKKSTIQFQILWKKIKNLENEMKKIF